MARFHNIVGSEATFARNDRAIHRARAKAFSPAHGTVVVLPQPRLSLGRRLLIAIGQLAVLAAGFTGLMALAGMFR